MLRIHNTFFTHSDVAIYSASVVLVATIDCFLDTGGIQSIIGETPSIFLKYKNHICKTKFYVVDLPAYCAILGIDWLETHNPTINFTWKELSFNSNHCISNCLALPSTFTTYVSLNNTNVDNKKENEKINNKINTSHQRN